MHTAKPAPAPAATTQRPSPPQDEALGDEVTEDGVPATAVAASHVSSPPPPRPSTEDANAAAGLSDGICTCGEEQCVAATATTPGGGRVAPRPFTTFLLPRKPKPPTAAAQAADGGGDGTGSSGEAIEEEEVDLSGVSFEEFKASRPLYPQMS